MTAELWTKGMVLGGAGQAANLDGLKTPQRWLPEPLRTVPGQFPPRSGPGNPRQVNKALTTNSSLMMAETMIVAFIMVPWPPSLPQQNFDMPYCVSAGPRLVNRLFLG